MEISVAHIFSHSKKIKMGANEEEKQMLENCEWNGTGDTTWLFD